MKRQRNTTQVKEQTRNTEIQINEEEIGKLTEKEFRIMIVNMIKNLENKTEKMQESINKVLEELKTKHTETNNTITEVKNTLEGVNSRISEAEEQITELEDKMVEITSEEQNKVKRMKRTEYSLRDLVVSEEEKEKGYERIFEEIGVENSPNVEKEIVNQVQETQKVPYRINPKRSTPKHILIKLTKTKHKERILKATREKQVTSNITSNIQGKPQLIFQQKLCRPEGNGRIYLKY